MKLSQEHLSEVWCLLSTLFFGMSWVGGKKAMQLGIGPLTFNALRFVGSSLFLLATRTSLQRAVHSDVNEGDTPDSAYIVNLQKTCRLSNLLTSKQFELMYFGLLTGLSGFGGLCLQQVALVYITATTAGFITSLFVIVTPILEYILQPIVGFESELSGKTWIAALVSLFGMFLLTRVDNTNPDDISTAKSDLADMLGLSTHIYGMLIMFISMLFISLDIICCDVGCKRLDCIDLTVAMFVVVSICSVITALLAESDQWFSLPMFSDFLNATSPDIAWWMVIVVSFTEGSGYTLASLGQMYTNPSRAAIIFTMEGVMTALLSYLLLGETLNGVESLGCLLVFGSTVATAAITQTSHVEIGNRLNSMSVDCTSINELTPLV